MEEPDTQPPPAVDAELTPTPRRRQSSSSTQMTFPSMLAYDSGNYSSSSNASECGCVNGVDSSCARSQAMLREKEQSLFLALQDVRKLRSELERLSKSEQWYKQELRAQKSTRLEALERLYTQERKYMQENQRLQRECVRLYEKCGEMEKELESQREKTLLEMTTKEVSSEVQRSDYSKDFKNEQQKALINDQQQLITVLRKQKRALLADLQRLSEEKDEKLLSLQQSLAGIEVESSRMTAKCKQLLNERHNLEKTLKLQETNLEIGTEEKLKLQNSIRDLREQLGGQEKLLELKENEIFDLQNQFKDNMTDESNVDEVHRLSMVYHQEINAKTSEIRTLKNSLLGLQEELTALADLQTKNEQQERVIENLNFTLETRQFELENLRQTDAIKGQQIAELQLNLERLRSEKELAAEQLLAAKSNLKSVEKELIALNEQYANMCALCERTRFDLEMREIAQNKCRFQEESDKREIEQLRERLGEYLQQTAGLSRRINELENMLDDKIAEKRVLEKHFKEMEQQLKSEGARCKRTESMLMENDRDMKDLQMQLLKSQERIENKDLWALQDPMVEAVEGEAMKDYKNEIQKLQTLLEIHEESNLQLRNENSQLREREEATRPEMSSENEAYLNEDFRVDSKKYVEIQKFPTRLQEAQSLQLHENLEQHNLESPASNDEVDQGDPFEADLFKISVQSRKLLQSLSNQKEFLAEKEQLMATFENVVGNVVPIETLEDSGILKEKLQESQLNMDRLVEENQKLNNQLFQVKDNLNISQLQQELLEKSQDCKSLKENLQKQDAQVKILQSKLLASDGKLYKIKRSETKHEEDAEAVDKLQQDHQKLIKELQTVQEVKHALHLELLEERQTVEELKKKLENMSQENKDKNASTQDESQAQEELIEMLKSKLKENAQLLENEANMLKYIKENARLYEILQQDFVENNCTNLVNKKCTENPIKTAEKMVQTEPHKKEFLLTETNQIQKVKTIEELPEEHKDMNLLHTERNLPENDSSEVMSLRAKVQELELKLNFTLSSDNDEGKRTQRINLINQLLAQQNDKVLQLNQAQAEWEELLQALNATQQLEENTRQELLHKREELEELNALFAEQNEELRKLQEYTLQTEFRQQADSEKLKETFQKKLHVMYEELSDKLKESSEKTSIIEELKRKNDRLQQDYTDDYVREVTENRKQLRLLQTKMDKLSEERSEYANRIEELEREVRELRKNKRQAMAIPTELVLFRESSTEPDDEEEQEATQVEFSTVEVNTEEEEDEMATRQLDDRLRILTKVLESEYRRKMKRYDIHIRTLLGNVKSLKRSLKMAEQRAVLMGEEQQTKNAQNLQDLQMMRLKYEQSLNTIKTLEQQLQVERQKYESSDLGKAKQEESAHEVANLIDDYKKLIQQSAVATHRPKTSAIYDLIQRSNKCVPNLNKLESTVVELRSDIQQFIVNYAQGGMATQQPITQLKVPSLMDELRAAAAESF